MLSRVKRIKELHHELEKEQHAERIKQYLEELKQIAKAELYYSVADSICMRE